MMRTWRAQALEAGMIEFNEETKREIIQQVIERFGKTNHLPGFTSGDHRVAFCRFVENGSRQILMFAAIPPSAVATVETILSQLSGKHIYAGDFHCGNVDGTPDEGGRERVSSLIKGITSGFWFSGDLVDEFLSARRKAYAASVHGNRWDKPDGKEASSSSRQASKEGDMEARLIKKLQLFGPLSAQALRRDLGVSSGQLLVLLRDVGAVRCDHGGRVLWRLA